ncbi:MAG: rane protein involved in aromatic hydrocarbon degradation [Myxococcales bacterium]|nr:rane protein involved in aromatic hydrocarbon degradation [Myxococcales bacterium]
MNKLSILVAAGLGTAGGVAHANGFLLNEFDAKAVGRGNASTATDVDPSSIYYNVGGIAVGEGTQFQIGGSLVTPNASFTDASGVKTESNTSTQVIPHIFITSRITSMISVGVGFYTPFGLAVSWPDNSPQTDQIHKEALHTFFITPAFGVNLGSVVPGLSAGGGFDIVPATVELEQDVFFGTERGNAKLGGTALGIGGRIGVMYQPHSIRQLSLGAMWRSDVKEEFDGTGDFNAPAPFRSQLPPDGPVKTSVTLPQSISGGVAVRPTEVLEIEANVIWTNWSKFKSLNIDVPATMGTGTMTISQIRNYEDKTTFRIGAEYRLPRLNLAVRAGYIYDPTPVPAEHLGPDLPDVDRHDLTLGGSFGFGNYSIHLGLLWVLPGSRKTSDTPLMPVNKGTYDVSAFVGSLTLSGRIGK